MYANPATLPKLPVLLGALRSGVFAYLLQECRPLSVSLFRNDCKNKTWSRGFLVDPPVYSECAVLASPTPEMLLLLLTSRFRWIKNSHKATAVRTERTLTWCLLVYTGKNNVGESLWSRSDWESRGRSTPTWTVSRQTFEFYSKSNAEKCSVGSVLTSKLQYTTAIKKYSMYFNQALKWCEPCQSIVEIYLELAVKFQQISSKF